MGTDKETQIVLAFKAIQKLSRGCTMKELAASLEIASKSAYRYVENLKSVGFEISEIGQHRYKIENPRKQFSFSLDFSLEETDFILKHLPEDPDLLPGIRQKLILHSDLLSAPNRILEAEQGMNIALLQEAIRKGKRVKVFGYASANSNEIKDKVVEPVVMLDFYRRLYAVDVTDRKLIQLKTERIECIELTDQDQFNLIDPKEIHVDAFWWVKGNDTYNISLKLSLSAYHIIAEEYPRIKQYCVAENENTYLFRTEVANLKPVTSLVLRLPEEIEVLGPPELESAIVERIKHHTFFRKYFMALSHADNEMV